MQSSLYSHLPHSPGVYKYLNSKGEIIYVGKAKDLKKRVASYFQKTVSFKTRSLIKSIARIEFVLTDTEHDAFLLESNLIKEYKPRYNINLKDDKRFPYIFITKEDFPRVYLSRSLGKVGEYLGPYSSVQAVRELLNSLQKTLQIRNCKLSLSEKNIRLGKFKPCLEYHLGYCQAPCVAWQSRADYEARVSLLRSAFRGRTAELIKVLQTEMHRAAEAWEFEKAQAKKRQIELLRALTLPSEIESTELGDLDILAVDIEESRGYASYVLVRSGRVSHTQFASFTLALDLDLPEILSTLIVQFRDKTQSKASEILVPCSLNLVPKDLKISVPTRADQRRFMNFALRNTLNYKAQLQSGVNFREEANVQVLQELQRVLNLPNLPEHIECFDNSHIQGAFLVSAVVVFRGAYPSSREYRTFHLPEVDGIDDFKSMRVAVTRHYKRYLTQKKPLPDLLIIDGGKGQLGAALVALEELNLQGKIPIVALAKRQELLFVPKRKEPYVLPLTSPVLALLQRIRDESHRFVLQFHRRVRSRGQLQTELRQIPSIGKKSSELLLRTFTSVEKIRQVPLHILASVVGMHKAERIRRFFEAKKDAQK